MKWISARDATPRHDERVLGFWYMGHEYEVVRFNPEIGWHDWERQPVNAPSHWMPLPEAPEYDSPRDPQDVTQR